MNKLAVVLMLTCGCASVEHDLTTQARMGIKLLRTSLDNRTMLLDSFEIAQRHQLDAAFDDDARARTNLTTDWVIQHRRAYAAGIDALNEEHNASRAASEVDRRNLAAIDAVLQRLEVLQSIRLRIDQFITGSAQ